MHSKPDSGARDELQNDNVAHSGEIMPPNRNHLTQSSFIYMHSRLQTSRQTRKQIAQNHNIVGASLSKPTLA